MKRTTTLNLPLPPPDADLRVGELGLPDADTSDWFTEALVDLNKLPADRMPPGSEIAVTLKVHPDQSQDLGWLWQLLAYVIGVTVVADVRDVIELSLQYDDDVAPGRVLVEAAVIERIAA
jgi:hypothetical protein